MNPLLCWEVATGLVLQIAVLVALTQCLSRFQTTGGACRLWFISHVLMLAIVGHALLFPHLRIAPLGVGASSVLSQTILRWQMRLGLVAPFIWGAVALVRLAWQAAELFRMQYWLKMHGRPLSELQNAALQQQICLPEGVILLQSDQAHAPFCWQLHRPVIVLPGYLLSPDAWGGDPDALRYVVAHELEHLRTHHPLQLFVQQVMAAVLWFHPSAWRATREAELAREYQCDAAAAETGSTAAYVRTLLSIAETSKSAMPHCLAFTRRPNAISRRLERLVRRTERNDDVRAWGAWSSTGVLLVAACLAAMIFPPVNPLSSSRSRWSPWPSWTAAALKEAGVVVRDYESFDGDRQLHDLLNARH